MRRQNPRGPHGQASPDDRKTEFSVSLFKLIVCESENGRSPLWEVRPFFQLEFSVESDSLTTGLRTFGTGSQSRFLLGGSRATTSGGWGDPA